MRNNFTTLTLTIFFTVFSLQYTPASCYFGKNLGAYSYRKITLLRAEKVVLVSGGKKIEVDEGSPMMMV